MSKAPVTGQKNAISDREELSRAAERLENAAPEEILRWAVGRYGGRLTLSVSFGGAEGMVLLDMLSRISEKVCVFTLDTGFLFKETVRFREEVMRNYPLPVKIVTPELTIEEQVERYGPELWSCSPDLCCRIRKIEPQRRWLRSFDAWVTGIRREQTRERAETPVVGWDGYFGVAKISPLAGWSHKQVEEYVREHEVPLNPLLEKGYKSIGCEPCTRPVSEGEDHRAGRWAGMDKTECGIHVVNGKVQRAVS